MMIRYQNNFPFLKVSIMDLIDKPLFTDIYTNEDFVPIRQSTYIYAKSVEERSEHLYNLQKRVEEVDFIELIENDSFFSYGEKKFSLKSQREINNFLFEYTREKIYLDITGLPHHIWAPLLRAITSTSKALQIIYREPMNYKFNVTPTEGQIFDLSERIKGISPIPGFAYLREISENRTCFIPLLGFEGTRLSYINEQVQPLKDKTFPVIGVPGFKIEYPFFTYIGNRLPLVDTMSWQNVRYVPANCPFSLYYLLDELSEDYVEHTLKIALIGTKPHSLGAILYAISHPDSVELIYDHPIRKPERTKGWSRLNVYHISLFNFGK